MRIWVMAGLSAALLTGGAQAQAGSDSNNPAIKDSHVRTTMVAAKGRNSFTEAQARGRIEKAGYGQVGSLAKNQNGVWQGKAMRDGKAVNVALDYKGNVTVH